MNQIAMSPPSTRQAGELHAATSLCSLQIVETLGVDRIDEPVTVGVPFPKGRISRNACLGLVSPMGQSMPLQWTGLAYWSDGSVQWALLDFLASVPAYSELTFNLEQFETSPRSQERGFLTVQPQGDQLCISTGVATFYIHTRDFKPLDQVLLEGKRCLADTGSRMTLTGEDGTRYHPCITRWQVTAHGPIRATVRMHGMFRHGRTVVAHFLAQLNFFAGKGLMEMRFTLHNPRAAHHPGGLWDLGDPGSILFEDLSWYLPVSAPRICWNVSPGEPMRTLQGAGTIEVYQDSSGGPNWRSRNHVNRHGEVRQTFAGYRVLINGEVFEEGKRATPTVVLEGDAGWMSGAIEQFWQNFPTALEVTGENITFRLFPHQYADVYELQGGEQKTQTVFIEFGGTNTSSRPLEWIHDRLVPQCSPDWHASTQAIPYLVPRRQDKNVHYLALIDSAIEGDSTFFDRREIIDEYGWRHFGDLYADHEAVGHHGEHPRVSHYNNQYDVIYGACIEFLRTGDRRWYILMRDLARHVIDIDIYHTQDDRPAYNGGLFWHTDHYVDAATATHRTYSRVNAQQAKGHGYGGGPSNEHNYTSGLLHYYFLTGDPLAYEAVMELAEWVLRMDEPRKGWLGLFDRRPTGLASSTVNRDYHGPGRGAGNSINALLDAYHLTKQKRFLDKTEALIRRCIHPHERIRDRGLDDVEHRWSYTVFLHVLGKYLDLKVEMHALDRMYAYARASLLHYAEWMADHEVPYKHVLDRVEIPTETWPAQDIRKSNVFKFAAKYADKPAREKFWDKAEIFFRAAIEDVLAFPTCRLTRPIVILLVNGYMHAFFQNNPEESAPMPAGLHQFGPPQRFTPQFHELYKIKEGLGSLLRALSR